MNDHFTPTPVTASPLNVIRDVGKGRSFVILLEKGTSHTIAESLVTKLSSRARVVLMECDAVDATNWKNLSATLIALLPGLSIRQSSFLSFGAACSVILAMALNDLKIVRTLIFVDGENRPHPSLWQRAVDRIERALPLGLPMRSGIEGFDAKPLLQRLRCPSLIVTSPGASAHSRSEATTFSVGLPTAFEYKLSSNDYAEELSDLVVSFQDVPAKCPQ